MKTITSLLIILFIVAGWTVNAQHNKDSTKQHTEDAFQHDPQDDANMHMNKHSIESMADAFESQERLVWQKPDKVVKLMGDLNGKTVMDIGSGTGYFSFRIADRGAKVICADVDERFLAIIEERKKEEGWKDNQIELRKVPYDSPELLENEVDEVIIVNTYHHIEDREIYFAKVKLGLKPGGRLFVVDFFKKELPFGPPVSMKLTEEQVIGELLNAGFTKFEVNVILLPNQYIIIAR